MELLDLNWIRLVLDGPSQRFYLWLLSLPVLGFPILIGALVAAFMDVMGVGKCVIVIIAVLTLWVVTLFLL